MMGKADGQFKPNDLLTREELAKVLVTVYELEKGTIVPAEDFCGDESKISDWAFSYVAKAYTAEIMKGMDNGEFMPQNTTTRAETAVAIKRLMDMMK